MFIYKFHAKMSSFNQFNFIKVNSKLNSHMGLSCTVHACMDGVKVFFDNTLDKSRDFKRLISDWTLLV